MEAARFGVARARAGLVLVHGAAVRAREVHDAVRDRDGEGSAALLARISAGLLAFVELGDLARGRAINLDARLFDLELHPIAERVAFARLLLDERSRRAGLFELRLDLLPPRLV